MPSAPLIALLCVVMFGNTFSIGAFPALLPELGTALGLVDWQLGTVAGAWGFARMVTDVPIGLFITHHLRRALVLGPIIVGAGLLCLASGASFGTVVAGRALMGAGHTLTMLGALTAVLRYRAGSRLASSLNAIELSAMLGIVGGVVVISLLPRGLPWNAALLVTCIPTLLGVLVLPWLLNALPREPVAAARPLFARGEGPAGPRRSGAGPLALAFGAGGAIALTYAMVEQFTIPLRGSREFGLDRVGIAYLLMITQVCDIVALLPLGWLADRRGVPSVLAGVLLVFAVALAMVSFGALPVMVAGCALFGVGMAGWMLPLGILRSVTPPGQVAWRTALYRVSVDAGIFLGPFLSGFLVAGYAAVLPALLVGALATLGALLLRARPGATAPSP